MNYKESSLILDAIENANSILLNCHREPDPDSVGCAIALFEILHSINKKVRIVCPTVVSNSLKFIYGDTHIDTVNFDNFDYSDIDLCMFLDSSSWDQVSNNINAQLPNKPIVLIDHHDTNSLWGKINLVDKEAASCAEIIYKFAIDCGFDINKNSATALLTGLLSDTGIFRYPTTGIKSMEVGIDLMKLGADKDWIVYNLELQVDPNLAKFWGEVLIRLEVDDKLKMSWSAIPYDVFVKYKVLISDARASSAGLFAQRIVNTDFGFVAIEREKNNITMSFRSRSGYDVSQIAKLFGGGGHIYAAGGGVQGYVFEEGMKYILTTINNYLQDKDVH